jgi:hypothetical protein
MIEGRSTRREFLAGSAIASGILVGGCNRTTPTSGTASVGGAQTGAADVTLRIGTVLAEVAKEHTISTLGYNVRYLAR